MYHVRLQKNSNLMRGLCSTIIDFQFMDLIEAKENNYLDHPDISVIFFKSKLEKETKATLKINRIDQNSLYVYV